MLIFNEAVSVSPVTTHFPLKKFLLKLHQKKLFKILKQLIHSIKII